MVCFFFPSLSVSYSDWSLSLPCNPFCNFIGSVQGFWHIATLLTSLSLSLYLLWSDQKLRYQNFLFSLVGFGFIALRLGNSTIIDLEKDKRSKSNLILPLSLLITLFFLRQLPSNCSSFLCMFGLLLAMFWHSTCYCVKKIPNFNLK